jgi:Glycosyltransferase family 87
VEYGDVGRKERVAPRGVASIAGMRKQMQLDRRVVYGFLFLMLAMNAAVFFAAWKPIMAGKNDFPVFYSNAQMVREGQAAHLYDFDAENSFVHRVSDVRRAPNNHLPYELLIFIPFTYLRFGAAHLLWTLASLGMLVGVAALMRSTLSSGLSFRPTLLVTLAFFPVWYCLLQGQDSILLVFLFALSFRLWKHGRDDAAGFALAMGLFRPQLVLPFVLVAFLTGKWKFVRGFVPGAVFVLLVSMWVVGIHGMAEYARILLSQGTLGSASALSQQWQVRLGLMPTLRGLLSIVVPASVPANIRNFLLLCGTSVGLLWAARALRGVKEGAAFDMAFATAVGAVAVVSFHSLPHDFSLIILPLLIAGGALASGDRAADCANPYTCVTVGFLLFFSGLYFVLIYAEKVGLLVLPTVVLLWLISDWEKSGLPARAAQHRRVEPISLPAS